MLVVMVLSDYLVNVNQLVVFCLIKNLCFFHEILLVELELSITDESQSIFPLNSCECLVSQILFAHYEKLEVDPEKHQPQAFWVLITVVPNDPVQYIDNCLYLNGSKI